MEAYFLWFSSYFKWHLFKDILYSSHHIYQIFSTFRKFKETFNV